MGGGGGGVLGGFGRSTARRVEPGEQRPRHVRRRRRHRRGRGRARRDRRLPQEPGALHAARRAHPARRAALRPAGHRQDAARARRRRRGRRGVLLAVGVRVRRGDRRRRRLARARPVQAGQGGGARRSSSSTSSTRSAARARATSAGSAAATTSASRRSTRSSPRWTASRPATNVIVLGGDEPPRGPRPGAAAPRPLRPPDRRAAAGQARPREILQDPHALGAARRPTSTSSRSPPRRPARPAPTSRCSSTRRRCSPPAATTSAVEQRDFTDAIEKIILGTERQIVMTDADRERTAYHESGHALVGMLTPGADPVRKISIIPRGQALGVTLSTPGDRPLRLRARRADRARSRSRSAAARPSSVVYGETTTGAESDIQNLTQIARGMVGRWGMSDAIGPSPSPTAAQDGMLLPGASAVSEHTQQTRRRRGRGGSSRTPSARWSRCSSASATASTRSRTPCSSARRSTSPTPTRSPASTCRVATAQSTAAEPASRRSARGGVERVRRASRSRGDDVQHDARDRRQDAGDDQRRVDPDRLRQPGRSARSDAASGRSRRTSRRCGRGRAGRAGRASDISVAPDHHAGRSSHAPEQRGEDHELPERGRRTRSRRTAASRRSTAAYSTVR